MNSFEKNTSGDPHNPNEDGEVKPVESMAEPSLEIDQLDDQSDEMAISNSNPEENAESVKNKLAKVRGELGIDEEEPEEEKGPDVRALEGSVKDFSGAIRPFLGQLAMRQDKRLTGLINPDEAGRIKAGAIKLSSLDFTKPESFVEAEMQLRGMAASIESLGKSQQRGELKEDLDNLGFLSSALRKVGEQADTLRYEFQKTGMPESEKAAGAAFKLKEIAEMRGKDMWRRRDALNRR